MKCFMSLFVFQVSTRNSVSLLEDPKEAAIKHVAQQLGLVCVGWIFTDLIAEDLTKGSVKHFRGNIVSMLHLFLTRFLIDEKTPSS